MKLEIKKIHLDLKVNWKLSRNQTTYKENFIITLVDVKNFSSEVAPNIRYGETPVLIEEQFQAWCSQTDILLIKSLDDLSQCLDIIPLCHSLRFSLESVFISYLAHKHNQSLSTFLKLQPPKIVPTSFSMPIIPVGEIKDYLAPLARFESLKIKVNSEVALDMLREIKKHTQQKLRVDGNEAWSDVDSYLNFEEKVRDMNIELVEQPLPSKLSEEMKEIKKRTHFSLLADESIEDVGDFQELSAQFDAINVKLMKTGSLIKARDLILKAQAHQMKTMIGCMIETSLGISYGMLFSGMCDYVDLDGHLLIKNEPFKLVSESEGLLKLNS